MQWNIIICLDELEAEPHVSLGSELGNLREAHGLGGSGLEVVIDDEAETALVNNLLALGEVGALKTDHDGGVKVERLAGLDDAGSNNVAAHDAAKNVDKDSLDLRIRVEELEGLGDLRLRGTATNVEEVGRLTTVQLRRSSAMRKRS